MLSKEVCKACSIKGWNSLWTAQKNKGEAWGNDDELKWRDKGYVNCPIVDIECNEARVNEQPPKWCFCKFEQAVAAGKETASA